VEMKNKIITYINQFPIYRNFTDMLPSNPALSSRSKAFRKRGILSEVLFWQQVHKNKFHNIDFDRQRVIGSYIVDFYCKSLSLVIEIDGSSHDGKEEYDENRDIFLNALSLTVHRISDFRVKHDLHNVMKELENFIITTYSKPSRPAGTPPQEGNINQQTTQ
jgi:very-short-patch-repair endonuclease